MTSLSVCNASLMMAGEMARHAQQLRLGKVSEHVKFLVQNVYMADSENKRHFYLITITTDFGKLYGIEVWPDRKHILHCHQPVHLQTPLIKDYRVRSSPRKKVAI